MPGIKYVVGKQTHFYSCVCGYSALCNTLNEVKLKARLHDLKCEKSKGIPRSSARPTNYYVENSSVNSLAYKHTSSN